MKNLFKNYTYLIPYLSNFKYYQNYSRVGLVGVKGRKGGQPCKEKLYDKVENTKEFADYIIFEK